MMGAEIYIKVENVFLGDASTAVLQRKNPQTLHTSAAMSGRKSPIAAAVRSGETAAVMQYGFGASAFAGKSPLWLPASVL